MTKFLISLLLLVGTQASLHVAGIQGKWTGFVDTQIGQFPMTVVYEVNGNQLSGYFEETSGENPFEGGLISGDTFEYSCSGNGYTFTHKGVVTGDTIYLNWSNPSLGEGTGKLARVE
ncbi:MAG: hypothetical protein AAF694_10870 [Bacteroidota bacterium]